MMLQYCVEYDAKALYNNNNCSWRPVLVQELGNVPPGRAAGSARAEVTADSQLEHGKSQSIPPELTRAQALSSSCNHSSFSMCELFSCGEERETLARFPGQSLCCCCRPGAAPLDAQLCPGG